MGCYTGEVGILGFLILYPVIPTSGTWIRRVSNISDHFILTGKSVIISNNQFKHIYSLNQLLTLVMTLFAFAIVKATGPDKYFQE